MTPLYVSIFFSLFAKKLSKMDALIVFFTVFPVSTQKNRVFRTWELSQGALRGWCVAADRKLTGGGCSVKLGLVYAEIPRLARYSR